MDTSLRIYSVVLIIAFYILFIAGLIFIVKQKKKSQAEEEFQKAQKEFIKKEDELKDFIYRIELLKNNYISDDFIKMVGEGISNLVSDELIIYLNNPIAPKHIEHIGLWLNIHIDDKGIGYAICRLDKIIVKSEKYLFESNRIEPVFGDFERLALSLAVVSLITDKLKHFKEEGVKIDSPPCFEYFSRNFLQTPVRWYYPTEFTFTIKNKDYIPARTLGNFQQ